MAEMGYDVFDRVRVGENQFVNEILDEKVIEAVNDFAPNLKNKNISEQFYADFKKRLTTMLHSRELLLTDENVPNCISA